MDTYEYIVEVGIGADKLQGTLNLAGQEGFKLAWMKPTDLAGTAYIVVFERKKPSNKNFVP